MLRIASASREEPDSTPPPYPSGFGVWNEAREELKGILAPPPSLALLGECEPKCEISFCLTPLCKNCPHLQSQNSGGASVLLGQSQHFSSEVGTSPWGLQTWRAPRASGLASLEDALHVRGVILGLGSPRELVSVLQTGLHLRRHLDPVL